MLLHLFRRGGSVEQRLFLTFLGISLISIISAGFGIFGFGLVRSEQRILLAEVYPTLHQAQIVALQTNELSQHLSVVFEAQSDDELRQEFKKVDDVKILILQALFAMNTIHLTDMLPEQLNKQFDKMSVLISDIEKLSFEMSHERARERDMLDALKAISRKITDETQQLLPIVAENILSEDTRIREKLSGTSAPDLPVLSDDLERFTQESLSGFQNIFDLQLHSESMQDALDIFDEVTTIEGAKVLSNRFEISLRAMTNAVIRMQNAPSQQKLAGLVSQISKSVLAREDIFTLRQNAIETRQSINDKREQLDDFISETSSLVSEFSSKMQTLMEVKSQDVGMTTTYTQFALIAFAAITFAASMLIYFFYVNNNIIFRLRRLVSSLQRMTAGNLSEQVIVSDDDQISQLEAAIEQFRLNSIRLLQADIDLKNYAEDLERSNGDLRQFAYVASHDLRAPLRGINHLADWIAEDLNEGDKEKIAHNIDRMKQRVARMDSLLTGILLYSRAGQVTQDYSTIDIRDTVSGIFDDLNSGHSFELSIETDATEIYVEETFFAQIVGNLIANAIKHHENSNGHINFEFQELANDNLLSVCDDGPGVPDEMRDKIFEMFQTLKARDELEADGIGLALVKKLVDRKGGSIVVGHSETGGACFTISWPK